jgi:hypothetical protein
LGVISEVSLLTPSKPSVVQVALFGCQTFEDVLNVFQKAKKQLGEIISGICYN